MKIKIFYLLAGIILISSCSNNEENKNTPDQIIAPIELAGGGDMVVSASNKFGFDIFQKIINEEPTGKNVFISPTSITIALSMTWNGARNSTADSMRYALRFPELDNNEINAVNKSLINGLTTVDDKVLLKIANSIWYRQDFEVEQDFITINQDYYNSEVAGLDFGDPASKDIINKWVEDNTNGKIKKLVEIINNNYVMFLINAIYFKGVWDIEFDKEKTVDGTFNLPDGSQNTIDMMNMQDTLNYFSNELFQAVELDYGRGNYSMVILLPAGGKSADDITKELNPENWSEWMGNFQKKDIILSLPRFKFEYDIQLKDALTGMGMGNAFNPSADFTGINRYGGIFIDYVRHKSFVEVNEEGTEAAAATVVAIIEVSYQDNLMYINRPFIFAIREKSTGAVVFIGRVSNPEN